MNGPRPSISQRSFEQAVVWFVALQSESCSEKQRAEFREW
jgi:ferric-dicitrate binding protein FerR (iron transport regulator)